MIRGVFPQEFDKALGGACVLKHELAVCLLALLEVGLDLATVL